MLATRGRATREGTSRYADRMIAAGRAVPGHFRRSEALDLTLSTIGMGTYRGADDDVADAEYEAAAGEALRLGCNVLDTAIVYRGQRSERVIGAMLRHLLGNGEIARDEVVVATKGGYLAFDRQPPRGEAAYRDEVVAPYLRGGLLRTDDLAKERHAIAPEFLSDQLGRSLANLGLCAVDVYFLHNPEEQLEVFGREVFERRLRAAFERLEHEADAGRIAVYGAATWSGYLGPIGSPKHLDLARMVAIARDAGGPGHRFRAIELPLSPAMTHATAHRNQGPEGDRRSAIGLASELGLAVFTSGSIGGGLLPASGSLQLVRSTPGVTTALVGMRQVAHVRANLALAQESASWS